jgi:hypothetical protein
MMDRVVRGVICAAGIALFAIVGPRVSAQTGAGVLTDGFEGEKPAWRQEKTDNQVHLFAHDRSKRSVREGTTAEHFQFEAGNGSGFYFSYALPKIPVTSALKVSLQARSDRPGVQLLGKVILPNDVDPETNQPSFVLVPGTILDTPDRWQRLELIDLPSSIERQGRVLRATTKRKVSLEGAYLDRLVVNVYGGPGQNDVFLDDLRVSPVSDAIVAAHEKAMSGRPNDSLPPLPAEEAADAGPKGKPGASIYKIERNGLTRQGYPWLFTAIRAEGADPAKLRRAGFDALVVPVDADDETIKDAVANSLSLIPEFVAGKNGEKLNVNRVQQRVDKFPAKDAVAFWSLGRELGSAVDPAVRLKQLENVRAAAKLLRKSTTYSGITGGEVTGSFGNYARKPDHIDLLGVRPFGWGTTQEPTETFDYLKQRGNLTALENADTLFYCWLPMNPPAVFKEAIWGRDRAPSWGVPRIQPDQLRLSAYTALAAGCRGLAFDATEEITLGTGRSLLIEAALLNEEVDLFEWLLADTSKSMRMLPCYKPDPPAPPPAQGVNAMRNVANRKPEEPPHPTIRAAAFTTKDRRGTVLLVADYAGGAQYQPPQMALNDLKIDVPGQSDAQAYEISPGDVKVLDRQRVPGGIRITIPGFGPTAIVYVTTDGARVEEIQRAVARVRPLAVNLLIEQAQLQYASITEIYQMLVEDGHPMSEGGELLAQAAGSIKDAQSAQEDQEYSVAWSKARIAIRPLQILMRAQWDSANEAIRNTIYDDKLPCGPMTLPGESKPLPRIVSPVSVPPLTSFGTLPQAWIWKDWIKRGRLSRNLLPSGDFEDADALKDEGWTDESYHVEGIDSGMTVTNEGPGKGKRALRLSGPPTDRSRIDKTVPFEDHPVAAIRTPPIDVQEANMIRISVMINMPTRTAPGAGGVIVRDSFGGEPLEFRSSLAVPGWQELVIYRKAPATGQMTVLLGYAGLQYALFDNLRIQKVVAIEEKPVPPVADARPDRQMRRAR